MRRLFRSLSLAAMVAAGQVIASPSGMAGDDDLMPLPIGGLKFTPDPAIEFDEEQVHLSARKVSVRYVLRNSSSRDRSILITAPLPGLEMVDLSRNAIQVAAGTFVNFINLKVKVDGAKVDPNWDQRALALGLDVTDVLLDADLPLGPDLSEMADAIADLAPDSRSELTSRGILQIEDAALRPAWTLHTTFYWRQTVKAGARIVVQVTYQPVTGHLPYSPANLDKLKAPYCITEQAAAAIAARATRGGGAPDMLRLSYLLASLAHWSKPSAKFKLIVEKDDPTVVMSTCSTKFAPAGDRQHEFNADNFTPDEDISVMFVR